MRRFVLAAAAVLAITTTAGGAAHALAAPIHGGPITTWQLEHTPSVPRAGGASTSNFDYFCSNGHTGHWACDMWPQYNDTCSGTPCLGIDGFPYTQWPGYTLRYSSKYLLLYDPNNGCLHITKSSDENGDYMNIVKCNTTDKNQRWSFPHGYANNEIKSSGDDACVQLINNTITGTPSGYQMHPCNASQSYQDWKWFAPGT